MVKSNQTDKIKKTMIDFQIYNTETRSLEHFQPTDPTQVSFYHCGPTVYWVQHIGNMRGMLAADLIRRSLLYFGYSVRFVRNYTDVGHLTGDNIGDADSGEDRMAKGAKREGLTPDEIADKYIKQFENDTSRLNILEPDAKPRATKYIQEMIDMVQVLLDKGFAYTTPKAVYFDISKKEDYTKLSGQKLELNKKGAGKGDVSDTEKRNPQDFALWFFKTGVHKNALQTWASPFVSDEVKNGEGFPGWHIECSAMSKAELGDTIDIHMGGIEHIPIHHTNEIAQSESANSVKFVNYWLHNEWLMIDGEKISKSEGNFFSVDDIVEKGFGVLTLRYLFLGAHYRSQQNFTWEALESAQKAYTKLLESVKNFNNTALKQGNVLEVWRLKFVEALSEDFNTPKALAVVWELLKSDAEDEDKLETLLDFDQVLGLDLKDAEEKLKSFEVNKNSSINDTTRKEIEDLIKKRNEARENKNWTEADKIRDLLKDKYSIELDDRTDGTSYKLIS